jgi:K+-transporting ATPase KdpF subunit
VQLVRLVVRETLGAAMDNLIAGIIALALFIYLVVAMLRPEKF